MLATVKGDVHDIGKNLVDIICTNNGYEVHNLGIKVAIGEMVAKVKEVDADAIGMSGLLVKSTLIMRENLEELNALGLTEVPVLLGGAALTRRYVERDLREIYEGRLFYGRDAFEGLSTLDALMAMKRSGEWDPDFGRVPTGRELPERSDDADASCGCRRARPTSPPTTRSSRRRSSASRVVKGIALDDIAEYVNETALFRNQWQFRPEKDGDGRPETDDEFKAPHPAHVPRAARRGEGRRRARAAGRVRLLPRQRRRRRPRRVDRRVPLGRGGPVPLPPPEGRAVPVHRRLLPRRSTSGERRLRRVPHRHDGRRGQRGRRPGCSPPTSTSSTCCCTASASRWPRRSPSTGTAASATSGGSSTRTARRWAACSASSTAAAATRGGTRPARTSRTTPPSPGCSAPSRLGIEVSEETGWQYQPEQTTSAIICHHPQAKYFVAR